MAEVANASESEAGAGKGAAAGAETDAAAAGPAKQWNLARGVTAMLRTRQVLVGLSDARKEVDYVDSDAEEEDSDAKLCDDEAEAGSAMDRGTDVSRADAVDQYARRKRLMAERGYRADPERSPVTTEERSGVEVRDGPATVCALERKTGWVEKVSPHWLVGWQPRWLVLEERQLRWYKTEEELSPQGVIDFDLVLCEVEKLWTSEGKKPRGACFQSSGSCIVSDILFGGAEAVHFRICPAGTNRAFELRVKGVDIAEAWVASIVQRIQDAEVRLPGAVPLPDDFGRRNGAWWKVHRISPEEFARVAQTGDVLLFRSQGHFPRLIRAASGGGRFDHVGLMLQMQDGDLGILEATGNNGVDICRWSDFLKNGWQSLYPELAVRRVFFQRTPPRLREMVTWCKSVLGKPYGLTIEKLRQRDSFSRGGGDTTTDFFCSQLVAEALKVLEVIPRGKSSTQFWPSTFSAASRPGIECCGSCSFDHVDLTIDFSMGSQERSAGAVTAGRDATTNWG